VAGIQAFLNGDYDNPRTAARGSKSVPCPHGNYRWQSCEDCDTVFLEQLLERVRRPFSGDSPT